MTKVTVAGTHHVPGKFEKVTTPAHHKSSRHSGGTQVMPRARSAAPTTDIPAPARASVPTKSTLTSSPSRSHSPGRQKKMKLNWPGKADFLKAQAQVAGVLVIAYIGNVWEPSYDRNENANLPVFWFMNGALLVAALLSIQHDAAASSRGVQLLSRPQTEEWKGWMQWAFIMYHYYRARNVYNIIRVFVSAYVWMTGFGNFLYFDKKQDFSINRAISMWLRINYFPLLLSFCLDVSLENYYVVPLHTAGFFITLFTCMLASYLKSLGGRWEDYYQRNGTALALCLLVHIIFYETPLVESLRFFSYEYYFRFSCDKYTAWMGMFSALLWPKLKEYMQWAYAGEVEQTQAKWIQRAGGVGLISLWWAFFGHINEKEVYNSTHGFVFWIPVAGWLMIRNSSKYLCECHSTVLEFFGRITLETYVLQFHVFMNHDVKNIPIIVPGSGPDGNGLLRFVNMLLTGVGFVALAFVARKITVTTQTTATELMAEVRKQLSTPHVKTIEEEEMINLKEVGVDDHTVDVDDNASTDTTRSRGSRKESNAEASSNAV